MRALTWMAISLSVCWALITVFIRHSVNIQSPEPEIVVGLPVPLSGNWAELGRQALLGAELAQKEINAQGGLRGHLLRFEVQDTDESVSPAKLIGAYRQMRSKNISLFIGPTGTPGGFALAPIASRDEVFMISPAVGVNGAFRSPKGNTFNIQGGWEMASRDLADDAIRRGYTRAAIFSSAHPFDKTQGEAFRERFTMRGGIIVSRAEPPPESPSVTADVTSLLRTSPDAIFISNYNQLGLIAKELRTLKYSGALYTVQIDPSRLALAQGALEGTIFGQLSERTSDFARRFQEEFGEEPQYVADYAYDAVMILAEAAKRADSFSPEALSNAVHGLEWNGASGHFSLNSDGEAVRTPTLWQIRNGIPSRLGGREVH